MRDIRTVERVQNKQTDMSNVKNRKSKKGLLMIPAVIVILGIIMLIAYGTRDKNSLSNYSVLYGSASDSSVELLKGECKAKTGATLYKYNVVTSHLLDKVIIPTNDIMTIPDMGRAQQGTAEGDYLFYSWENNLYIYAADDVTMERAINYFVNKCVDESGTVLLADGEVYHSSGIKMYDELFIESAPISVFSIYYEKKYFTESANLLQYYIAQSSGVVIDTVKGRMADNDAMAGKTAGIELVLSESLQTGEFLIEAEGCNVLIRAADAAAMEQAVYMFANRYLGWYFAGTDREHFNNHSDVFHIEIAATGSETWIEEREPIITLWNENYPRGFYLSTDVSLEADIMSFSDDQLYDYVRMMQYCGYTGIQVTDMCSSWAGAGGYESVQDKIRVMFEAAHCLGMNTTLWVWGAEFDGYGWTDTSVTIERTDTNVRDNAEAYEVFNEYYDKYAELADCTDRLIAHFYDPGNLSDSEDIAFYSKLLWSKFSAVNPKVDFGINCWGDKFDKAVLCRELGSDFTIYEGTIRNEESGYQEFRSFVNDHGNKLGTWSWNNCEMEIDQLAQMNYNVEIIKSTYLNARDYDSICKPQYWSEMDSNHMVNIFSLYCAAQLLQNPDLDTYELTEKIAMDAVGPEYESELADILILIQRARSGENWDTYFWSYDNYILLSDDYPAELILQESEKALADLDEMIAAGVESYSLPMPISMTDLLSLVRPQIQQIHDYAEFRIALDELEMLCEKNADMLAVAEETDAEGEEVDEETLARKAFVDTVTAKIAEIGEPIKEYNTVIGSWGQIEARAQQILVREFCEQYNIEVPHYVQYDAMWKYRIRSQFASYQRGNSEPVMFPAPYYQYGYALGNEETERLVSEMVRDGILIRDKSGSVYLADWDNYIYMTTY